MSNLLFNVARPLYHLYHRNLQGLSCFTFPSVLNRQHSLSLTPVCVNVGCDLSVKIANICVSFCQPSRSFYKALSVFATFQK